MLNNPSSVTYYYFLLLRLWFSVPFPVLGRLISCVVENHFQYVKCNTCVHRHNSATKYLPTLQSFGMENLGKLKLIHPKYLGTNRVTYCKCGTVIRDED